MSKVKRALISVSDKKGIVEFAQGLNELEIEILSTGGTARAIKEAGVPVRSVSDYTGFPEMLDGRVKTLHPRVHGALLARRNNPEHMKQVQEQGIELIDLVVVNLYPFEETVAKPGVKLEEAIENIDIGGPSMLRSAAKNYESVVVVTEPGEYAQLLKEMQENEGRVSRETRQRLAAVVFRQTAKYDTAIGNFLQGQIEQTPSLFPVLFSPLFEKVQDLRYGENPHQAAAFYKEPAPAGATVAWARKFHGKELSFNNIIDLDAALEAVKEFEETAAVVIKHTNPCGMACGESLLEAYRKARACDPVSAFGSVVGLNRKVDRDTAAEINKTFVEAVIAPGFEEEALEILKRKEAIRLLEVDLTPTDLPVLCTARQTGNRPALTGRDLKKVGGGLLVQELDRRQIETSALKIVTKRKPTEEEFQALLFAWRVVKQVKSNAIVFTTRDRTIGIGAGQMSRVDSCKLAVMKANFPLKGTVVASDAFFPQRDGVEEIAKAGATAIIQPGGSKKDAEVIAACDEHNLAMVFTGMRHFRH